MKSLVSSLFILWLALFPNIKGSVHLALDVRPLDESTGQFLYVPVGSTHGTAKGRKEVVLSAAPFAIGNTADDSAVVYFPLFDIADVFGFTVTDLGSGQYRIVSGGLPDGDPAVRDITLNVGSTQGKDNRTGETFAFEDAMGRTAEPIMQDGVLFVPGFFLETLPSIFSAGMMTPSQIACVYGYNDGRMMAGFRLEDDYFLLPEDQTQDMVAVKTQVILAPDENGDYGLTETYYTNGDITLGVRTGYYAYEQSSAIHCITLLTDRYETPRGLRVGDPVEWCLALYGKLPNDNGQIEAGVLELTEENGIIQSITLRAGT